jgi:diguanylate cyclase (GGDEF)-like protein/PAS domain S-box-containing protein
VGESTGKADAGARVRGGSPNPRPGWPGGVSTSVLISVLAVAVGTWMRLLLDPFVDDKFVYFPYVFSIAVASWYGGSLAAALAVPLSGLAVLFLFVAPRLTWHDKTADEAIGFVSFLLTGALIAWLGGAEQRAHRRALQEEAERRRAEEGLRNAQARLQIASEVAQFGFYEWNPRTDEVYFSPEWKRQLGYDDDELPSRFDDWIDRLHPDDREATVALFRRFAATPWDGFRAEFRMRHRDGTYRWIDSRATMLGGDDEDKGESGRRVIGSHLDITEHKLAEARVRYAAQHDSLTGLPNRALTYEFAEHLLSSARRGDGSVAVLFVDLDRFKPINDTYGHDIGDGVLKEVANRLLACVRGEDVVGRLGGDEFLVALSHVAHPEDAARAAKHAIASLGRPFHIGGLELAVSPSIGISLYPGDAQDLETLIKHADSAMYHAKENGRNNFQFFTPELNQRAEFALCVENQLRLALKRGEFTLHYQPIVAVENAELVGAEALLRWPHTGMTPDQFISIAETSGIIQPLGEWVLAEACRQQRAWREEGLPDLTMSVNVSPLQFRQKAFRGMVAKAVVDSGIEPHCLRLELTEGAVMKGDDAAAALGALKDLGLGIALDRFGKGYSNLGRLSHLPIDAIKVDQDLVQRLTSDGTSLAITEAIIAIGRTLGLKILAGGIETAEVFALLKGRRCEQAQGYHLCRPLPADEFSDWYWDKKAA